MQLLSFIDFLGKSLLSHDRNAARHPDNEDGKGAFGALLSSVAGNAGGDAPADGAFRAGTPSTSVDADTNGGPADAAPPKAVVDEADAIRGGGPESEEQGSSSVDSGVETTPETLDSEMDPATAGAAPASAGPNPANKADGQPSANAEAVLDPTSGGDADNPNQRTIPDHPGAPSAAGASDTALHSGPTEGDALEGGSSAHHHSTSSAARTQASETDADRSPETASLSTGSGASSASGATPGGHTATGGRLPASPPSGDGSPADLPNSENAADSVSGTGAEAPNSGGAGSSAPPSAAAASPPSEQGEAALTSARSTDATASSARSADASASSARKTTDPTPQPPIVELRTDQGGHAGNTRNGGPGSPDVRSGEPSSAAQNPTHGDRASSTADPGASSRGSAGIDVTAEAAHSGAGTDEPSVGEEQEPRTVRAREDAGTAPSADAGQAFGDGGGSFGEQSGHGGTEPAPRTASRDTAAADSFPPVETVQTDEQPAHAQVRYEETTFAPEPRAGSASAADAPTGAVRARTPDTAPWLRTILAQSAKTLPLEQGWKSIQVELDEGHGTMTVRARRGEDGISIAVSFSDPNVRALAEAQTQRLEQALRSEYDSKVDLSLMSDGSQDTPSRRGRPDAGRSHRPEARETTRSDDPGLRPVSDRRAAAEGIRNEWIG